MSTFGPCVLFVGVDVLVRVFNLFSVNINYLFVSYYELFLFFLFLLASIIKANAIASKTKPNMPNTVPNAALVAYKPNAIITHRAAIKCKFIIFL